MANIYYYYYLSKNVEYLTERFVRLLCFERDISKQKIKEQTEEEEKRKRKGVGMIIVTLQDVQRDRGMESVGESVWKSDEECKGWNEQELREQDKEKDDDAISVRRTNIVFKRHQNKAG